MKNQLQLQQGDVLIRSVDSLPKHITKKPHTIVAYGEVTGHKHEVMGDGVEVFECDGVLYVSAPHGGTIRHEEHHSIEIPPGYYSIGIVREYDHFLEESRSVAD